MVQIDGPNGSFGIGRGYVITFIAGPCVIEDIDTAYRTANALKEMFSKHSVSWIYNSSFD